MLKTQTTELRMKANKLKSETNKLKNYSLQRLRKRFEIRLKQ